ncbi:hypothetical protein QE402_001173 [Klebsiella sp. SORGH_AS 1025]|nr:hypothetical protein [Klebsiella variicola]MDR6261859.1 hypothetical protein [Klebsiella sp. SORGH_AS_0826]MDR6344188.1 hypothetical protein [Klebsiella sp. SORGH_AS_1025]MDR6361989.1 hypothetical protein [Klebsiella sp. SORGH_AS_1173]MDR6254658.1 hypothetical protein [Klebsiella variicola]
MFVILFTRACIIEWIQMLVVYLCIILIIINHMSRKCVCDAARMQIHSLIYLHKTIDGLIVVYNGYGNKYEDE